MERYRVRAGTSVNLAEWNPRNTGDFEGGKRDGRERLAMLTAKLAELQQVLWAQGKHKLLVVLQAMDTGGKDGTIRGVLGAVNPQGVRVVNFKVPSKIEIAHDYLWRIHANTPGNGKIAVFNRSQYEDVLVVRVLGLVPQDRWQRRYDHINSFERLLADEGTTIVKFYLHISKAEQKERLEARLADPSKHWKFKTGDLDHRAKWDEYTKAYEDVLTLTSTDHAPWYIVPADRKWFRNLVVAETLVATLEGLGLEYPKPEEDLSGVVVE